MKFGVEFLFEPLHSLRQIHFQDMIPLSGHLTGKSYPQFEFWWREEVVLKGRNQSCPLCPCNNKLENINVSKQNIPITNDNFWVL